jgi:hypothetical protein
MPGPEGLTDDDLAWMRTRIQAQHTTPEGVERHRAAFRGDPMHVLVIDEALDTALANAAAHFLATEAAFTMHYAACPDEAPAGGHGAQRMTAEEWAATPPERRFLRFGIGPGEPGATPGWKAYLALREALCDERFRRYVECLSGYALGPLVGLSAHAMSTGDLLAPHDDVNPWRVLACNLYLSPDWHAGYGGALRMTGRDDRERLIEPRFNRLVLFEVAAHKSHCVEPIAAPPGVRRLSLAGWFVRRRLPPTP